MGKILMDKVYYDVSHPASYGGVSKLAKYSKVSTKVAREWLKSQDTYTLHKPTRTKFRRRRTITKGINDLFQMDLVDVSSLA